MNRIAVYAAIWVAFNAAMLAIRFTRFAGASSDERFPLGVMYLVAFAVATWIAMLYEARRAMGGRGTALAWFRRLAGTIAATELHAGMSGEMIALRRLCAAAFAAAIVIVPLLVW